MYRARVDAVSGTKIFADGKWLTCIGNKKFSVGEMVYTDGRCVYGNYLESQQPLIITAPTNDEGIPIITENGKCFSFEKNRLKSVGDIDKKTLMINDYRRKVFTSDDSKIIKDLFDDANIGITATIYYKIGYDEGGFDFISDISNIIIFDEPNILAANIDKAGNIFLLVGNENSVEVIKNGSAVHKVDLIEFLTENVANMVEPYEPLRNIDVPDDLGFTVRDNSAPCYYLGLSIRRAFIEDENNFEILVSSYSLWVRYWENVLGLNRLGSNYYLGSFQITKESTNKLKEEIKKERDNSEGTFVLTEYTINRDKLKCSLGDGYYYTVEMTDDDLKRKRTYVDREWAWTVNNTRWSLANMAFVETFDTLLFETVTESEDSIVLPWLISIFNRSDQLLLSIKSRYDAQILINKVGGSYILAISDNFRPVGVEPVEVDRTPDFSPPSLDPATGVYRAGLYLFRDGVFQILADGKIINQRLRPLKKSKKWQRRIQDFSQE